MARKNAASAADKVNGLNISVETTTTTTSTSTSTPISSGQSGTKDAPAYETNASTSLASDPLASVKVNNVNLGEVKSALDDVVKKHLASQQFTPSPLHPTIHLSLGYASIAFAAYSTIHSYLHKEFEASKPGLWIGVIGYFALQGVLWGWKRWVEKGEVYSGRRKRVVKRIETDNIQITTSTSLLPPPSSPTISTSPLSLSRPTSPTSQASPANGVAPLPPVPIPIPSLNSGKPRTSISISTGSGSGPSYLLTFSLTTTSNNGKSLLSKSRVSAGKAIGEMIDSEGGVEEGEVGRWLGGLLSQAGLVGVGVGVDGAEAKDRLKED